MNLTQFLDEARRARGVRPQPEDPNAPTTPARQAIRDTGDVGQTDMLAQIYPQSNPKDPRQFIKKGQELATSAGVAQFGDEQDPIDRALDITRGPSAYQQRMTPQTAGAAPKRKDFKSDAAFQAAKLKYDQNLSRIKEPGLDPGEYEELSAAERMQTAADAGLPRGRLSARGEVEDALKDARTASELPRLRQPIDLGGGREVLDRPYLRHGFQSSGVGLPQMTADSSEEDRDDFLDQITAAQIDPDKPDSGGKIDPTQAIDTGGIDKSKVRTPTARDLETVQQGAEDMGVEAGKEYLTPEVLNHQAQLRKALATQDNKAIQDLAFSHEISDEVLDQYIERFGQSRGTGGKEGKMKILARIETFGISDADRQKAAYGGDLFDGGEVPDEYKPKYNAGTKSKPDWKIDPTAPEGVVDLTALPQELRDKAIMNRGRELVRTYLKQGGTDAYAPHEGLRAMTDMDLEHIRSLKADLGDSADTDGDESNDFGYDHPNNWVFASGQLNKLRAASPLTDRTSKYMTGPVDVDLIDKEQQKSTYDAFIADMDKEKQKKFKADMGSIGARGSGAFTNTAGGFKGRTQDDIEKDRQKLIKNYGATEDQAAAMIPDIPYNPQGTTYYDPDTKAGEPGRLPGQGNRMGLQSYPADPSAYAQDVRTDERDEMVYNAGIQQLKQIHGNKKEKELLKTPEGMKFKKSLAGLEPAAYGSDYDEEEVVEVDDGEI